MYSQILKGKDFKHITFLIKIYWQNQEYAIIIKVWVQTDDQIAYSSRYIQYGKQNMKLRGSRKIICGFS